MTTSPPSPVQMWKGRLEKSTLVTVSEKILVPNRRLCCRKRSQISPPCSGPAGGREKAQRLRGGQAGAGCPQHAN